MSNVKTVISLFMKAFLSSQDDARKSQARYELMVAVTSKMGFRLYNQNLWWHEDEEYKRVWAQFPEANLKIHDRRFNLYNLVKSVRNLAGDSVECGVFRGGGSHLILSALNDSTRAHHIFDSFEGLSEPENIDLPADQSVQAWVESDLSAEEFVVEKNLAQYKKQICLYKGWIPDRFQDVSDLQFRFVHIDVDLYQPTKDALEFFYPRMVKGGMIVCDDYGSDNCPGATKAMDECFDTKAESVIHLTTGTGLVIKN
jgi:hypothetical protein